jgi:hypothetical protein
LCLCFYFYFYLQVNAMKQSGTDAQNTLQKLRDAAKRLLEGTDWTELKGQHGMPVPISKQLKGLAWNMGKAREELFNWVVHVVHDSSDGSPKPKKMSAKKEVYTWLIL